MLRQNQIFSICCPQQQFFGSCGRMSHELRRGTPYRKSNRGRISGYSAKRGNEVYQANRTRSRRKRRVTRCTTFVNWCIEMMQTKDWSIDACVGYGIESLDDLQQKTDAASARFDKLSDRLKASEKRLVEIAALKPNIINYSKTRDTYVEYRKSGYSRKRKNRRAGNSERRIVRIY